MQSLRLMTFNLENLFDSPRPMGAEEVSWWLGMLDPNKVPDPEGLAQTLRWQNDLEQRGLAALLIQEAAPDVLLLQEVGSERALDRFHDRFLAPLGLDFPYRAAPKGNDRRGIGVAAMSRLPLEGVLSHRMLKMGDLFDSGFRFEDFGISHHSVKHDRLFSNPETLVFRRDCLEIRLEIAGRPLLLFSCHFKSMSQGRPETFMTRVAESAGVAHLLRQRAVERGIADYAVAGDFNDYTHLDGRPEPGHGLAPLLESGLVEDVMARIPDPRERWTHFDLLARAYRQLDAILLSPALAARSDGLPLVLRGGLARQALRAREERLPRVGWEKPAASDHCPIVMPICLEADGPGG